MDLPQLIIELYRQKPPRLFKYTNQEFDDANQAEKDDRVHSVRGKHHRQRMTTKIYIYMRMMNQT
ncbi:hypothetical protein DPMN_091486 [Dreissena polymorpha]|uniref:Uncharacterized protein n=1 Tax=Dreissena polymorpha TaxID=45954 RepID=A0A9D4L0G8_DREPO|nr:hypothetical protein DPMN_091486 [Dreissena polymorpha]